MIKAELHYSTCIDENCEKVFCVNRRELESKLKKALAWIDSAPDFVKQTAEWIGARNELRVGGS